MNIITLGLLAILGFCQSIKDDKESNMNQSTDINDITIQQLDAITSNNITLWKGGVAAFNFGSGFYILKSEKANEVFLDDTKNSVILYRSKNVKNIEIISACNHNGQLVAKSINNLPSEPVGYTIVFTPKYIYVIYKAGSSYYKLWRDTSSEDYKKEADEMIRDAIFKVYKNKK